MRLTAARILAELVRRYEALEPTPSQRELAEHFRVTHGAIQHHAKTLRREGYMHPKALWPTVAGYNYVRAVRDG